MQTQMNVRTIQKKLKDCQYALTSVVLQDIIITKNSIIGIQITKGLWYKLRIYCAINPEAENPIITEYVEQFLYLDNAKNRIEELLKDSKK